jgi:hypothetical protein
MVMHIGSEARGNTRKRNVLPMRHALALGQGMAILYPGTATLRTGLDAKWRRAATHGQAASDRWQSRRDGSRFWANFAIGIISGEFDHEDLAAGLLR